LVIINKVQERRLCTFLFGTGLSYLLFMHKEMFALVDQGLMQGTLRLILHPQRQLKPWLRAPQNLPITLRTILLSMALWACFRKVVYERVLNASAGPYSSQLL